jgi:hypothetical protein
VVAELVVCVSVFDDLTKVSDLDHVVSMSCGYIIM